MSERTLRMTVEVVLPYGLVDGETTPEFIAGSLAQNIARIAVVRSAVPISAVWTDDPASAWVREEG